MDFLPDFELLRFWKHTVTSDECLAGQGSVPKGQLCPACDTTDPMSLMAGWKSGVEEHCLSVQEGHRSQQLQLS